MMRTRASRCKYDDDDAAVIRCTYVSMTTTMRHSYVAQMSQVEHINDDDNEAFIRCTYESRRTYA